VDKLHAALQPWRQHITPVLEVHDGDALERHLEVLGENGEGALRHGPVTDEQDFVSEFQHDQIVLARHFVRKYFAIQEFIEKRQFGISVLIFVPFLVLEIPPQKTGQGTE
jgi:hypothetical protein